MSIDLSQFYEVFFEESFEGLDAMESELLELEPGNVDSETINTIFRAAHSIKGGSGTFGFTVVSDFTHVLETLLDQIRDGQRELELEHVDLLLKSVDCLREILSALQASEEPDTTNSDELKVQFEKILAGESAPAETPEESSPPDEQDGGITVWNISFIPSDDILCTGNEPVYMLQELEEMGGTEVIVNYDKLPDLADIEPENCYISWQIELESDASKAQIEEVFEWVADESDISISAAAGLFEPVTATDSAEPEVVAEVETAATAEPQQEAVAVAEKPAVKPAPQKKATDGPRTQESASIRVGIDKVDSLINMVGELVITQAMLTQLSEGEFSEEKLMNLQEGLAQLSHNTRDLQESVMRIRMMPISFVFSRFPRLVRDISSKLGKQVELKLIGEQTELDKTVMEKIVDPMVHLVRNSLDHGLETPDVRAAKGKPETGTVTLNAFHQGGNIVIEIIDDGAGINTAKVKEKAIKNGVISESDNLTDDDINQLIFQAGFSTADEVSDLSGRGVGMDVVRRNIEDLNGSVELVSTPDVGSTFTIRLPLTLAILDGQLVKVGKHTYIIPLISIVESLEVNLENVNKVGGETEVLRLRDEYIPIIRLYDIFTHVPNSKALGEGLLVVVESDNSKVGILVDDLLAQQQVVIKSLEANYQKVDGISGATILGDGTVSLIIDITGVIRLAGLKRGGIRNIQAQLSEAVA